MLFGFAMHNISKLGEDLHFSLAALLVVELGQGAFLVGTVDLVLLSQTYGLHTTMPGGQNVLYCLSVCCLASQYFWFVLFFLVLVSNS